MATHTQSKTTNKKKLVYTQGPDGVFRLKKDAPEKPKKSFEGYYNELVDCSYKVPEQPEEEMKTVPEETTAPYPTPVVAANTANAVMTTAKSSYKEPKNVAKDDHTKPPDGSWILDFIRSKIMTDFHAASFCYGFIICLALNQSQPLLGQYAVIIFDIMKVGLLWMAILGGLAWYFGIINTQNTASLLQLYTQKVNSIKSAPPVQEEPVPTQSQIPAPQTQVATPLALIAAAELSKGTINQSMPELHKPEFRPSLAERRNTLSRITPFYSTHSKNISERKISPVSQINQNKFINETKSVPKKTTSLEDRRNSSGSVETTKSVPVSNCTSGSSNTKYIYKELPLQPPQIDELPFVNEIKLLSEDELEDFDFSDSMNIKRSNSVLSKKSLLGTRNNYKKFMANVSSQKE